MQTPSIDQELKIKITQIVRRFGQSGGMESYVFHLARALDELGISVSVLCEEVCDAPPNQSESFAYKSQLGSQAGCRYYGFLGRLDSFKGAIRQLWAYCTVMSAQPFTKLQRFMAPLLQEFMNIPGTVYSQLAPRPTYLWNDESFWEAKSDA